MIWNKKEVGHTIFVALTGEKNKGFTNKEALMMRPKTFITKTERDDFGHLKRDIADGKIGWRSINKIVAHIIKNRTAFSA
jgi:hypothetical protein